jgi:hypothetical protein
VFTIQSAVSSLSSVQDTDEPELAVSIKPPSYDLAVSMILLSVKEIPIWLTQQYQSHR